MLKNIFENDDFIIKDSGKDYDFRYVIENKHDFDVKYYLIGLDDFLEIDKKSWIGLINGDYTEDIINCLINDGYEGVEIMNKDNAMYDFNTMIQKSWTYNRMTTYEKKKWIEILNDVRCDKCLKGTYKHRWEILQAIYNAYLIGIGYSDFNWRDTNEG